MYKPAGTVTGLYREDYGYNPTSPSFNPYKDVWRETKVGMPPSADNDDSYEARIHQKKKGQN